jgi:CHAT domain-containing protein
MRYQKKICSTGLMITIALGIATPIGATIGFPQVANAQTTPERRKVEADGLLRQGIEQAGAKQFEASIQSWEAALKIYREINDRLTEGSTLGNLGIAYAALGNHEKAIDYQSQYLIIARETKNRPGEENALKYLGRSYDALGNYSKAIVFHQQRLVMSRELKYSIGEIESLSSLGIAYYALGDYPKAIEFHQQGLTIAREMKNRRGEANALGNLGNAYDALGQYSKAIEYQEQSLGISIQLNDRLGEGQSLSNLGNTYRNLGNYSKAIEYQERYLAIALALGDRLGQGNALTNLGNAYNSLGNYQKAIGYYEQSLVVMRERKNRLSEGATLGNLGLTYYYLGNYAKSITYQEQRLVIARELNDRLGESQALGNLGLTYDSLGQYTKAIEHYQQSLAIARAIKDRKGEGTMLGNLGVAYWSLEDYPKSIDYHEKHLAVATEINDRRGQGNALGNLGNVYYAIKNYPKVIEYQTKSLAIATEIKNRFGEATALGNLGNAYYAMGNYPKAVDYHQQRLTIAREINDRLGAGGALNNLGLCLSLLGKHGEAETHLREAIATWESLRSGLTDNQKISIAETQANTYRLLQSVLVQQNRSDAALEIAEQGRSRAFAELLTARLDSRSSEVQKSLTAPNLEDIRNIAKVQNATLVEYSIINPDLLYIWVVKPNGTISFHQSKLDAKVPIAQLVADSRSDLRSARKPRSTAPIAGPIAGPIAEAPESIDTLKKLHQVLIEPIAADLPTDANQRVIFMPQGDLFGVPFPALQTSKGQFLIERHTLSTAPSIQTLQLTHEKAKLTPTNNNVLVVGNPDMPIVNNVKLDDLPGAETEAIAIAKIFDTQPMLGNQATKAAVLQRMKTASIVHFATHGLLDTLKGDIPGAVALASSGQDSGLLTSSEIFDLKLTANLFVLSACDTGRGDITGDGVVGLSRSLISAGIPSVIVTLWAIPDGPTAELMTNFYAQLKQNPDKAQALRQAMLKTMRTHPNPRDWAAFTLIGEAQ